MKTAKIIDLFIVLCITLCASCQQDIEYTSEIDKAINTTQNSSAICLLRQMEIQTNAYEKFKKTLHGSTALFDYVTLSSSSEYGIYYTVPYMQNEAIEGYIIYPIDNNLPYESRKSSGIIGDPINIDNQSLSSMPYNQKFLLSIQFLEWAENGLKVNPSLSTPAKTLEEQDLQISIENISPIKLPSARGVRDAITAELYLEYKTNYTNRVSKDGTYIEVTAPNINIVANEMQKALEFSYGVNEAIVYHTSYQTLKIYITFEVGFWIDKDEIRKVIRDASTYVNANLYNNDHVITFSTYYTYTLAYPDNYQTEGFGSSGNNAVFEGGSHFGAEDYETQKWLEEEERKRRIFNYKKRLDL